MKCAGPRGETATEGKAGCGVKTRCQDSRERELYRDLVDLLYVLYVVVLMFDGRRRGEERKKLGTFNVKRSFFEKNANPLGKQSGSELFPYRIFPSSSSSSRSCTYSLF